VQGVIHENDIKAGLKNIYTMKYMNGNIDDIGKPEIQRAKQLEINILNYNIHRNLMVAAESMKRYVASHHYGH